MIKLLISYLDHITFQYKIIYSNCVTLPYRHEPMTLKISNVQLSSLLPLRYYIGPT